MKGLPVAGGAAAAVVTTLSGAPWWALLPLAVGLLVYAFFARAWPQNSRDRAGLFDRALGIVERLLDSLTGREPAQIRRSPESALADEPAPVATLPVPRGRRRSAPPTEQPRSRGSGGP